MKVVEGRGPAQPKPDAKHVSRFMLIPPPCGTQKHLTAENLMTYHGCWISCYWVLHTHISRWWLMVHLGIACNPSKRGAGRAASRSLLNVFVACRFWWPDHFCQVILRRHSELCPLLAKVALVRVRADVCVCVALTVLRVSFLWMCETYHLHRYQCRCPQVGLSRAYICIYIRLCLHNIYIYTYIYICIHV